MNNFFTIFEWVKPVIRKAWLNSEAGIFFWTIAPGVVAVPDDHGKIGFYQWTNSVRQFVKSVEVDNTLYARTTSLEDCKLTNESFYYDTVTTYLYVHFDNFDPPLGKSISYGYAVGVVRGATDNYYFNDVYYGPELLSIFGVSLAKDPLYFGKIVFGGGSARIQNQDGAYDNFADRNLFGQPASILIGRYGATYDELETVYSGYIADYSYNWDEINIEVKDLRENLKRSVAGRLLTLADFPFLSENSANKPRPVAYGINLGAPPIALNETQTTSSYTFLICDTQYSVVESIEEVRVEGVAVAPSSVDLVNGTFVLSSGTVGGKFGDIEVDFTMPTKNGIDIITDLMTNYADRPFVPSFWDVDEVNAQVSRNTSLYIDDETKLWETIETVANDIDGNFIVKPSGLFTVRILDETRDPVKTLYFDDWSDDPETTNTASEYLSSVVVAYSKNIKSGKSLQIENEDFEAISVEKYGESNKEKFETNLTSEADAISKSETVLKISSIVQDITSRSVSFETTGILKNQDILPVDIVTASPVTRVGQPYILYNHEVLAAKYDFEMYSIGLEMRRISDTEIIEPTFSPWKTSTNEFWSLSDGQGWAAKE